MAGSITAGETRSRPSAARASVRECAAVNAVTTRATSASAGRSAPTGAHPAGVRRSTDGSNSASRNNTWSRPIQMWWAPSTTKAAKEAGDVAAAAMAMAIDTRREVADRIAVRGEASTIARCWASRSKNRSYCRSSGGGSTGAEHRQRQPGVRAVDVAGDLQRRRPELARGARGRAQGQAGKGVRGEGRLVLADLTPGERPVAIAIERERPIEILKRDVPVALGGGGGSGAGG